MEFAILLKKDGEVAPIPLNRTVSFKNIIYLILEIEDFFWKTGVFISAKRSHCQSILSLHRKIAR